MILNKYGFGNGTYVKLDELNDLMKTERRKCMQEAKKAREDGKTDIVQRWITEHGAIVDLARKINMSENGEKYVIFRRDEKGEWEYFMELVNWENIPNFVRRHMKKRESGYATVGTNDIDEATLYECIEDAEDALASIVAECKDQAKDWHYIKKWMFDTRENREAILNLFYDGGEEKEAEKKDTPSKGRCPGRYAVWYRNDEDTTVHCMGFVRFEHGIPVFTNRPCKAHWFVWRGEAEAVAQRCGVGFMVVDMFSQMTPEERLLRAIFHEDGMDGEDDACEWHGDGTSAEDEDWDGDDE